MPLLKLSRDQLTPVLEEPMEEISWQDFRGDREAARRAEALVIPNDADLSVIGKDVRGFGVVILEFPVFKDGRAYSQARLLRERYGYKGEIRARGEVLRDQLFFMMRCGVNAFEFSRDDAHGAQAALREFSLTYQGAADKAEPVWRRRQARAAAA
jgi:uncharacterized protein (DUF934 family)